VESKQDELSDFKITPNGEISPKNYLQTHIMVTQNQSFVEKIADNKLPSTCDR
jgi:hypothetical protein